MRKVSLSVLSILLVLTLVLSACSDNNISTPKETNGPSPAQVAKDYTLPIVKDGSVVLSFAAQDNIYAPKSYTQGLPVWNEIEKITGVKIKWDVTPGGKYKETMNLRLAAGRDLPDIITLPDADPVKLSTTGLIIPLDDLIANHAPNIRKYFKEFPERAANMRLSDGKIYALTADVSGASFTEPYGLLIRKDWLKKLGLSEPKTLDDWYTVLKAFKEKDPNGNGKADEIPYVPRDTIRDITLFGSALGLHLFYSRGFYPNEKGIVEYQWMDTRTKDLIVWLNKLYKEGLIDPQMLNNKTYGELLSKISRDLVGATATFSDSTDAFIATQKEAGVTSDWGITLPPSSANYKGFYEKNGPQSTWWAITKDAKDPVTAIKWLDYIYASEEGNRFVTYGVEGLSYKIVDGKPVFTDFVMKNPEGLSAAEALRSIGAMPITPWNRTEKGPLSTQPMALLSQNPRQYEEAQKVKPYLVNSFAYMAGLPTIKEGEEIAKLMTDIQTYQDETIAKFILGQSPIDWDKFVSTLKSLGIETVIKHRQSQYDRAKASQ
ncbi:extracellular solute-binding protein [Paenibacillus koleovorans]|uniref:extracellular solute-binding protein n=1 Tax=Paenibacillus koleovorans TaxID=121608 RepID=UPI000FDC71AE|nr:extracellular solute-binding protein [Paenibacillus koleovorans]